MNITTPHFKNRGTQVVTAGVAALGAGVAHLTAGDVAEGGKPRSPWSRAFLGLLIGAAVGAGLAALFPGIQDQMTGGARSSPGSQLLPEAAPASGATSQVPSDAPESGQWSADRQLVRNAWAAMLQVVNQGLDPEKNAAAQRHAIAQTVKSASASLTEKFKAEEAPDPDLLPVPLLVAYGTGLGLSADEVKSMAAKDRPLTLWEYELLQTSMQSIELMLRNPSAPQNYSHLPTALSEYRATPKRDALIARLKDLPLPEGDSLETKARDAIALLENGVALEGKEGKDFFPMNFLVVVGEEFGISQADLESITTKTTAPTGQEGELLRRFVRAVDAAVSGKAGVRFTHLNWAVWNYQESKQQPPPAA